MALALACACGSASSAGVPAPVCTFELEGAPSEAIPTVGVVSWSTDLPGVSEARIEFTLNDAAPDVLNRGSGGAIDIAGTTHRALMLGLKPERTYTYRIVAKAGATTCVSASQTLTTGRGPDTLPPLARRSYAPALQARGFIVTSSGYGDRDTGKAFIIDADGEVVWWANAPRQCSRALMDWEGNNLWMLAIDPSPSSAGGVSSVGMDGTGAAELVGGLERAHHDLVAVPGGVIATLAWIHALSGGPFAGSSALLERSPDGSVRTVVNLDENVFPASPAELHANAVRYHAADDTYTVSDLYASAIIKLTRQGELLWQVGGDCSNTAAPKCATLDFDGNHGHELLDNGNLLLFAGHTRTAYEYRLTETAAALTADLVWSFAAEGEGSTELGDVQRLPNGNTLVNFSTSGDIYEVSPTGDVVQVITADVDPEVSDDSFGYASFRETLYGPPPQ